MKPQLILGSAACVLLASAFALAPSPLQSSADTKLEALQKDLAETKARVEQLAGELKETRGLLEATHAYLDAQTKAARSMADTLDASEKAGFTAGINPDSRQLLLRGWREQLGQLQQNLPVLPPAKSAAKSGTKQP